LKWHCPTTNEFCECDLIWREAISPGERRHRIYKKPLLPIAVCGNIT